MSFVIFTISLLVTFIYVGDTDSLSILCREVSDALGSERALSRTLQGPSDWHRRMERREECWEGSRGLIFEEVIKNQALPEDNVTVTSMYVAMLL